MTERYRPPHQDAPQTPQDAPGAALPIDAVPVADFTETSTETATKRIREAMAAYTSEDAFRRYLTFQSQQHQYSPFNCMLILGQRPDATIVMPFGKRDGSTGWRSVGRWVKRGEEGIGILAPMIRPGEDEPYGFKRVRVYDVAQTDGKPLPESGVKNLTGNDPIGDELFSRLVDFTDDLGVTIERFDHQTANGVWAPATSRIGLNWRNSGDQELKTLAHETAHVLTDVRRYGREDNETIAEMAAHIALGRFGIDTSEYSVGYIAGWAKDMARFERNVFTGQKVAKQLIEAVTVGKSPWTYGKGERQQA